MVPDSRQWKKKPVTQVQAQTSKVLHHIDLSFYCFLIARASDQLLYV